MSEAAWLRPQTAERRGGTSLRILQENAQQRAGDRIIPIYMRILMWCVAVLNDQLFLGSARIRRWLHPILGHVGTGAAFTLHFSLRVTGSVARNLEQDHENENTCDHQNLPWVVPPRETLSRDSLRCSILLRHLLVVCGAFQGNHRYPTDKANPAAGLSSSPFKSSFDSTRWAKPTPEKTLTRQVRSLIFGFFVCICVLCVFFVSISGI